MTTLSKRQLGKDWMMCQKQDLFLKTQIDFLSIDTQSNYFEVLKSLNFQVYQPTVIAIESNKTMFGDVLKTQEYLFLKEIGYNLSARCGLTLILKN